MAGKEKEGSTTKKVDPTPQVLDCSCKHDYQDTIYGAGKRLHNISAKGEKRCTVCGNKKP